jgi:hypothetical protein
MAGKALTARPSEHRRGPQTGGQGASVCCGRVVLDNERVLVLAFGIQPGQSTGHQTQREGVRAHHPNTLYIFIKGSQWLSSTTNPPSEIVGNSPDGDVGWMPAIDISAGHESGNTGSTPSDVVWIALKK